MPEPDVKGYGIRAVPGATLKEMIANCAAAQPGDDTATQLKWEECAQLHRSLKTQPGNTTRGR